MGRTAGTIPPSVIEAVRRASQEAREAGLLVKQRDVDIQDRTPRLQTGVCPYCEQAAGHATRCKLWMLTPEQQEILYGYPVCRCHQLPDSKERDAVHRKELNRRVKDIFR